MINIEFFKQQAKNLFKDYKTQYYNEDESFYEYKPCFFNDFEEILVDFDISDNGKFTLMNSQHIIALLAGFNKWNDLIKASEPLLELGYLLLTNRNQILVEDWKMYERANLKDLDDEAKLEIFKIVFLGKDH